MRATQQQQQTNMRAQNAHFSTTKAAFFQLPWAWGATRQNGLMHQGFLFLKKNIRNKSFDGRKSVIDARSQQHNGREKELSVKKNPI
jgi:hypothetical protein